MFLFHKKILYLSVYRGDKKEESAGFVRFIKRQNECRMELQVKKGFGLGESCMLHFWTKEEKILISPLQVQAGVIHFEKSFCLDEDQILIRGTWYDSRKITQIAIQVNDHVRIAGYLSEPEANLGETSQEQTLELQVSEKQVSDKQALRKQVSEKQALGKQTQGSSIESKEKSMDFYAAGTDSEYEEVVTFDSKWEQLMHEYPQIHPFGDERVFISIEPKDFIVLRASYQKLINNSFLLHGFYNYRYLILGPDKELGDREGECFYLGVPGTYFEREKMVAVMFGFEGFECAGAVQIGKFGFYMRRVEL